MRRFSTVLPALVLAACFIPRTSHAVWSGTTTDEVISFDDNADAQPVLIHLGLEGNLHLFWAEDAGGTREIHHGRSQDNGASWSSSAADRVISFPNGNDANGRPDVAQADVCTGYTYVNLSDTPRKSRARCWTGVGVVIWSKAMPPTSVWFFVTVARSRSKVWKLWTGCPSAVRFV